MGTSKIKKTQNLIYSVPANSTKTFQFDGTAAMILIKRYATGQLNLLISVDFWASGYQVLSGTVNSYVVITKNENSYEFTIQNKAPSSFGVVIV